MPNGVDRLQREEITALAASADGVDVCLASDVDEVVIETDALHAVDKIDKGGVFHACHFGAKHMLQFAVGSFEKHFRGRLHHHHVAPFQDAVKIMKVGVFNVGKCESLAKITTVDGDDHLVVDVVLVGV